MAHAKIFLNYMRYLWKNGNLTDTVICCHGSCVTSHAVILSAYSKIFAAMLNNSPKNADGKNFIDISETGVELECLGTVLEYFYTGNLPISNTKSIDTLISAVKLLHIPSLAELLSVPLQSNEALSCHNNLNLTSSSGQSGDANHASAPVDIKPIVGELITTSDVYDNVVPVWSRCSSPDTDTGGSSDFTPQQPTEEESVTNTSTSVEIKYQPSTEIAGQSGPLEGEHLKDQTTLLEHQRDAKGKSNTLFKEINASQKKRGPGRPRKYPPKPPSQLMISPPTPRARKPGRPRKLTPRITAHLQNATGSPSARRQMQGGQFQGRQAKYRSEVRKLLPNEDLTKRLQVVLDDIAPDGSLKGEMIRKLTSEHNSSTYTDAHVTEGDSSCTSNLPAPRSSGDGNQWAANSEEDSNSDNDPLYYPDDDEPIHMDSKIAHSKSKTQNSRPSSMQKKMKTKLFFGKRKYSENEEDTDDPEWSPTETKTPKFKQNLNEETGKDEIEFDSSGKKTRSQRRKVYQCTKCNEKIQGKSKMLQHLKMVHDYVKRKRIKCQSCDANFVKFKELTKHRREKHGVLPSKKITKPSGPYICSYCAKLYNSVRRLNEHVKIGHWREIGLGDAGRSHLCEVCGKGYYTLRHLQAHRRIHRNKDKEHKCPHCNVKMGSSIRLRQHVRWKHEEIRAYVCTVCGKALREKSTMKQHMAHAHGLGDVTKYPCAHCDKVFTRPCGLRKHVDGQHSGKTYKCDVCEKTFSYKSSWVAHCKHAHPAPGSKFECECGRVYGKYRGLEAHKLRDCRLRKSRSTITKEIADIIIDTEPAANRSGLREIVVKAPGMKDQDQEGTETVEDGGGKDDPVKLSTPATVI